MFEYFECVHFKKIQIRWMILLVEIWVFKGATMINTWAIKKKPKKHWNHHQRNKISNKLMKKKKQ
jgi:hypothetical protein